MFTSLKKLATQAGLRTDDEGESTTPTPPVAHPQASATHSAPQLSVVSPSAQYSQSMGIADPEMVKTIRESVLKASPVITMFNANCELMRKAIPHDETIRMRAALAMMTNVDKATLLAEVQRTVTAALAHQKSSAEAQRDTERNHAIGSLEREHETLSSEIISTQEEIVRQQTLLTQKQTRVVALQGEIRTAETSLKQQNSVIDASFAEVERHVQSLVTTLNQL